MATREAPVISQTSRIGRGRICSLPPNIPGTHASTAALPATMSPLMVATRAPTMRFIWMRSFCSDTHFGNYQLQTQRRKRNEKQGIDIGGTDRRVEQRSVGGRYRGEGYWHEGPLGGVRRRHCGQDVSRS